MTQILSFLERGEFLDEVELEIALLPGLPQIHVLGLPDRTLQESLPRIKCALRKCGFHFPKAQQIIVNLRPGRLTHPSKGLDAAIALGILIETGQVAKPEGKFHIYAELNLEGDLIFCPALSSARIARGFQVERLLTGFGIEKPSSHIDFERIKNLSVIAQPGDILWREKKAIHRPPEGLDLKYSPEQALILQLFAVRPFHLLLAGSPGAGKTTLMKNLSSFLPTPEAGEMTLWPQDSSWWPVVSPHSSVTKAALYSHGRKVSSSQQISSPQGEIFRAQNGFLLLDKFLEFKKEVLESLRSPLDGNEILISKFNERRLEQSKFICVATTNLCPCGHWVPGEVASSLCGFAAQKCRSTSQKLSGPLADRFAGVFFLRKNKEILRDPMDGEIQGYEILARLQKAWIFQAQTKEDSPKDSEPPFMLESSTSRRRSRAFRFLAENAALLDESVQIQNKHWEIAYKYSIENFELLSRGPC